MMGKFSVIGGGSWGTAIAQLLARNNHEVLIYVRNKDIKQSINNNNINKKYFPEYKLAKSISATDDLQEAVNYSKIIIFSVPTQVTRKIIKKIYKYLTRDSVIVSTAKGIEKNTYYSNRQIINEYGIKNVVILSGPTHAEEVIRGIPSAAVIASREKRLAAEIQKLFMSSDFRFYVNSDVIGVEIAGAIKNIIALAAGIADGLGYGDNSRAALITRGLREISRFGELLGGNSLTFSGLAGMGDLVVTCTSMHSRNRRFGINIGQGMSFKEAQDSIGQVVEGIDTTRAIYNWVKEKKYPVELPITEQAYKILFKNKNKQQAVEDLMLRDPKYEMTVKY